MEIQFLVTHIDFLSSFFPFTSLVCSRGCLAIYHCRSETIEAPLRIKTNRHIFHFSYAFRLPSRSRSTWRNLLHLQAALFSVHPRTLRRNAPSTNQTLKQLCQLDRRQTPLRNTITWPMLLLTNAQRRLLNSRRSRWLQNADKVNLMIFLPSLTSSLR